MVIGSFSLGNALPELETFATAVGAITVIYEVIDKVPLSLLSLPLLSLPEVCLLCTSQFLSLAGVKN